MSHLGLFKNLALGYKNESNRIPSEDFQKVMRLVFINNYFLKIVSLASKEIYFILNQDPRL